MTKQEFENQIAIQLNAEVFSIANCLIYIVGADFAAAEKLMIDYGFKVASKHENRKTITFKVP